MSYDYRFRNDNIKMTDLEYSWTSYGLSEDRHGVRLRGTWVNEGDGTHSFIPGIMIYPPPTRREYELYLSRNQG